jgi:hypothetical protein
VPKNCPPLFQRNRAQENSLVLLLPCQFFITKLPDREPFFKPFRPVQLTLALEAFGELRKQCRRLFIPIFKVCPEEIEGCLTVACLLDMALRHFGIEAPFRRVGSSLAAIVQTYPMLDAGSLETSLQARRFPALIQRLDHLVAIDAGSHEEQHVVVGVPAVVHQAFTAMRHLQGTHLANATHAGKKPLPCPTAVEVPQRLRLTSQDELELVAQPVGGSEGQEPNLATLRLVHGHGCLQLDPPSLADLRRTDRAGPDRTARLKPLVAGGVVLPGTNDLNLPALCPEPQAVGRPAVRENPPSRGLESETLPPG